jgi:hypothetical protein
MLGRRRGSAGAETKAIAAALVWHVRLPEIASFQDLSEAVGRLHGRRLVFSESPRPLPRKATGFLVETEAFTGILVSQGSSPYYSELSQAHELCHLIVRNAPDEWFPPGTSRPRQPTVGSRFYLRLCPRNSGEESDAESVREELIVEEMAREFMRRFTTFAETAEEEHFG